MSDSNFFSSWPANLIDSQKMFMDALGAFTKKSPSSSEQPWLDAMNYWWKSLSGDIPGNIQEFFMKSMEQARIFYFLGDQFNLLIKSFNEIEKKGEDWQRSLNDQIDKMKAEFNQQYKAINDSMHSMMGAWNLLPMDTLNRTFSFGSLMPGDILQEFKSAELQTTTDKFLSIPGVGYTREYQEQIQIGIKLWNEFQQVLQEYNHALSKVGMEALDGLRNEIIRMSENGEEINSLRQIYDLWVDCNEKAYADYVYTEEYSELYGRMTNTLMAVKRHGRNLVDEVLGGLNMPTRKGMNTMQRKQQDLVRKYSTANQKIKTLEKEISELREIIKTGKKSQARKASTTERKSSSKKTKVTADKRISKKKTAKKKTTKKKTAKKKTAKKTGKKKSSDTIVIKL